MSKKNKIQKEIKEIKKGAELIPHLWHTKKLKKWVKSLYAHIQ